MRYGVGVTDDPVAIIAEQLRAGQITPEQAVDRVLGAAVDGLPAGVAADLRAQIRARLEELLATDPYLQERVDRLHDDD